MAKKGKKSSAKNSVDPPVESTAKGKKGKKSGKQAEMTPEELKQLKKDDRKKQQQAHRAKVTSTTSWTGKLPHTLLHELVQKRKWGKVEYSMRQIDHQNDKLVATAILTYLEPKTKELLKIKMLDPLYDKSTGKGILEPQETPAEARHMAATIAMYRIAYNTNLHMMLPPNHKKIWYELDDYRKKLIAEKKDKLALKYFNTEPFQTLLQDRKDAEQLNKEREARANQNEKIQQTTILISSSSTNLKSKAKPNKIAKKADTFHNSSLTKKNHHHHNHHPLVSFPKKAWENATIIDLNESTRQLIEVSLKSKIDWNSKRVTEDTLMQTERLQIMKKLTDLNFRENHIKESLNYRDPLSFLLFNLPDDDLPPFFQKKLEDSQNKIEIAALPLATRMSVERLMESGVSRDEALFALEKCDMLENEAAGLITENFISSPTIHRTTSTPDSNSIEIWNQELESLVSIYDDIIEDIQEDVSYTIVVDKSLQIKLKVYRTNNYPNSLPGVILSTFNKTYKLPNYIKQQILIKLLNYITVNNLLGDMMIYNVFEWCQENIKDIIDNPGPLLTQLDLARSSSSINLNKGKTDRTIKSNSKKIRKLTDEQLQKLNEEYKQRINSNQFKDMQLVRSQLPAWKKQDIIVNLIEQNDVTLITGETGSGKSTQVVQFLLDSLQRQNRSTSIICTQPRRISAIGLAERVSDERCVNCGDEVGYIIRGVNKTKNTTRIKFMTTGVLVRILQTDKEVLTNSIIVIDEVHERSIDTDLIVTLLKNLLGNVPNLKIVLMSATVNVDVFKKLFPNLVTCHIEGRTFPITDHFLDDILPTLDFKIKKTNKKNIRYYDDDIDDEDTGMDDDYLTPGPDSNFFKSGQINYDLLCQVAIHVDNKLQDDNNDGSIIIFLPGIAEIDKCCRMLKQHDDVGNFVALPLHSALTPEDQKKVFRRYNHKRKIVVSTNIAETSITIDDCVATIDTGRAKTMYYNARDNTTRLKESFISKAESKQRRGRAGRVREGLSFKLYSRRLYEEDMVEMPTPEIKRVALESLYLSVKAMGIKNVTKFLASGLESPPLESLQKAERMLTTVGLLDNSDSSLTELGRFISLMPVMDSKHGKLLIYSIIFGMTDIGVLIVSILSAGSLPFIGGGAENRDNIKKVLSKYKNKGDLLAVTDILQQYLNLENKTDKRSFIKDNFLSYNKISEIMTSRVQYYSMLKDTGFLPFTYKINETSELNRNNDNINLIESVLTGSLYPNIARVQLPDPKFLATSSGAIEKDPEAKKIKFWIRNEEYMDKINEYRREKKNRDDDESFPLPLSKAFIHPSSVLFQSKNVELEEMKSLKEIGDQISDKYTSKNPLLKLPFVLYNTSHFTDRLWLTTITPTSTISLLLFGGPIAYDVNGTTHSPGIIIDDWLPIRMWCKNAVLIKQLRIQLDNAIKLKLDNPKYSDAVNEDIRFASDIFEIVEDVIVKETRT